MFFADYCGEKWIKKTTVLTISLSFLTCGSSEQSDDEQPQDEVPNLTYANGMDQSQNMEEEDIIDAKLQTLKELFPQRNDQELLQVINGFTTFF